MSTPRLAPVPNTGYVPKPYDRIVLRPFDPARDDYETLTVLLHRAFGRLGAMGLNCPCVDQPASATRQRALAGTCFVATCHGHVIATMTLHERDQAGTNHLYRCRDVASLRQFGVDPIWQSRGVGRALVAFAVRWAASRGYARLALDTPYPATHLLAFYRSLGFEIADVVRFAGRGYDSAILCRSTAQPVSLPETGPRIVTLSSCSSRG
ncbi:GNAT family N-acetyltransferase [Burkholderia gladioli]|uniref:GNAT family N-acetyltransferase n=1 Tax=Burkholderia gladioli TaxID=28095 RepID=UPI000D00218E|nr:GNAT family N-acetyltransferase [Burkholderia gladioli]PRG90560.1 GNAT family N-acetyltransferase [Burkholderia gladioli]URV29309.1 GNAT family N-acetyltransferase [Burkholderia gladioli]